VVLVGVLGLVPTAAVPTPGGLDVGVSSGRAGARPVQVSLTLRTRLQCGSAAGAAWHITFPPGEQTPPTIAPAAVTVNGHAALQVTVAASRISVTVPRPSVLCDIVAPGKVTFVFTRAAALGNPKRSGIYGVTVGRGRVSFQGTLRIHT
jgi:hypothetical protein